MAWITSSFMGRAQFAQLLLAPKPKASAVSTSPSTSPALPLAPGAEHRHDLHLAGATHHCRTGSQADRVLCNGLLARNMPLQVSPHECTDPADSVPSMAYSYLPSPLLIIRRTTRMGAAPPAPFQSRGRSVVPLEPTVSIAHHPGPLQFAPHSILPIVRMKPQHDNAPHCY